MLTLSPPRNCLEVGEVGGVFITTPATPTGLVAGEISATVVRPSAVRSLVQQRAGKSRPT